MLNKNILMLFTLLALNALPLCEAATDTTATTTASSTGTPTTTDGCVNETIDELAKPYQLQYRPSLNSQGCGIGSLTDFNLFGGSLGNSDFFSNALCSAVRAKTQPYINQVNSGISGVNNGTSLNQVGSGLSNASSGLASGTSPSVLINNFSNSASGTTSNLNQLFQ